MYLRKWYTQYIRWYVKKKALIKWLHVCMFIQYVALSTETFITLRDSVYLYWTPCFCQELNRWLGIFLFWKLLIWLVDFINNLCSCKTYVVLYLVCTVFNLFLNSIWFRWLNLHCIILLWKQVILKIFLEPNYSCFKVPVSKIFVGYN